MQTGTQSKKTRSKHATRAEFISACSLAETHPFWSHPPKTLSDWIRDERIKETPSPEWHAKHLVSSIAQRFEETRKAFPNLNWDLPDLLRRNVPLITQNQDETFEMLLARMGLSSSLFGASLLMSALDNPHCTIFQAVPEQFILCNSKYACMELVTDRTVQKIEIYQLYNAFFYAWERNLRTWQYARDFLISQLAIASKMETEKAGKTFDEAVGFELSGLTTIPADHVVVLQRLNPHYVPHSRVESALRGVYPIELLRKVKPLGYIYIHYKRDTDTGYDPAIADSAIQIAFAELLANENMCKSVCETNECVSFTVWCSDETSRDQIVLFVNEAIVDFSELEVLPRILNAQNS